MLFLNERLRFTYQKYDYGFRSIYDVAFDWIFGDISLSDKLGFAKDFNEFLLEIINLSENFLVNATKCHR